MTQANQTQTNRTTTQHGYPILHAKLSERNPQYSVVLASIRINLVACKLGITHNTYHPFVVWTMNNATGTCEGGDYCLTLPEAIKAFDTRR
tara:strand:+ start:872 stop:1144 length:273 start_codon:yes stop_codon:yes gene_type:complete